jgi:hypothetical protein
MLARALDIASIKAPVIRFFMFLSLQFLPRHERRFNTQLHPANGQSALPDGPPYSFGGCSSGNANHPSCEANIRDRPILAFSARPVHTRKEANATVMPVGGFVPLSLLQRSSVLPINPSASGLISAAVPGNTGCALPSRPCPRPSPFSSALPFPSTSSAGQRLLNPLVLRHLERLAAKLLHPEVQGYLRHLWNCHCLLLTALLGSFQVRVDEHWHCCSFHACEDSFTLQR